MLAAVFGAGLLSAPGQAQTTPLPGSPLRADILNALRPTVQNEIGGAVEFVVRELRVLQNWAFVSARPQRPGERTDRLAGDEISSGLGAGHDERFGVGAART